jgi:hypothetical protein
MGSRHPGRAGARDPTPARRTQGRPEASKRLPETGPVAGQINRPNPEAVVWQRHAAYLDPRSRKADLKRNRAGRIRKHRRQMERSVLKRFPRHYIG